MHLCVTCQPVRPVFSGLIKAANGRKPIEHERAAVKRARSKMRRALAKYLKGKAAEAAQQLAQILELAEKRSPSRARAEAALAQLELDWSDAPEMLEQYLAAVAVSGGGTALEQLGIGQGEERDLMRLRAEAWARQRSAELVGMKWVAGELVPNPRGEWQIDEATRSMLRTAVEDAIDEGWSAQKLAEQIAADHAFSDARAETIARTEIAFADTEGTLIGWERSGLVTGKEWLTADDCCDECQALDGEVVGLRDEFPGGVSGPPAHPNCRCTVLSVLADN
jgi:SPP1 gp7 family putative phage head morphogenesis protein